jgi:hypothetical protein
MKRLGTVKFTGESGARYAFAAYPLEAGFTRDFQGVYVVTRRREGKPKGGFLHLRIGVGQSDGLRQPPSSGGWSSAVRGANCICLHVEKNQDVRLNVVHDLMRKSGPAAQA